METEKMKMKAGKLYDANYDKELLAERAACADLTYELNQLRPSKAEERDALVRRILLHDCLSFLLRLRVSHRSG